MKFLLGDSYLGQSRIVLHVNIPRTLMISGYIIFFNYTQSQEHITKGSRLHIHNQYYDILVKYNHYSSGNLFVQYSLLNNYNKN